MPIAVIGNVHYAPINDLAWCGSNEALLATSSDGYCSIITIRDKMLIGERLDNEQVEDETLRENYEALDGVDFSKAESVVKN